MYDKSFIVNTSRQEHDRETFIADSGTTSHKVNLEENMTNLRDSETRFTVGESRTLTGTKYGNWNGCQIHDGQIHWVKLSNAAVIPGLHKNIISITRALQKGFQVVSEYETWILKKNSSKICFDEKMVNNNSGGFLLTKNFYKSEKNTALLTSRGGSRKLSQPYCRKGWPSINKRKK